MKANNIYEEKPWLKSYPPDVPAEVNSPSKSVNEAFDEAVEKWKRRNAIIFYGNKISFVELKEEVDRFATALSDLGIRKGDRVGLLLLNSPEFIIAFYSVLRVGAIVTPISPIYVSPEIRHQLEDSGTETIICQDILYGGVEKTGIKFKNVILANIADSLHFVKKFMAKSILKGVYQKMAVPPTQIMEQEGFYKFKDLIKKYPPNPPKVQINPKEDIAVLPYTGGTTGRPKGVMITHGNIIAEMALYKAFYPFLEDGKENWIGYMPFYHIAGMQRTVVQGILSGYTLVPITTPDLDDILNAIATYQPKAFLGAPTIYELLKDYKKTGRVNWKAFTIILSGADALNEATFNDWKDRTGVPLHDSYGMTEITGLSHACPLGKPRIGSIGIPAVNTMAAILDPDKDEYLSLGERGEMVVAGPQVSMGYWNNPEATKECEAVINGIRWWRTGDLAMMGEDGFFFIYDRKRDLIKYKGLRVFAREVEEVLKTHPQIKEVGVIGVPDKTVGENVKAMVVLETDARGKLSEADIIAHCEGKLAHYKIPKIVEFVGEIPKTDVGKVSRRELREMGV